MRRRRPASSSDSASSLGPAHSPPPGAARRRRKHGGRKHVGGALRICARRARLPAPQHRLGHGEPRAEAGSGVASEGHPPPNPPRLGDLRAAAARVPPVGSPPPTPRLSAVGAAFSRSWEVLEMPDAFTRVSSPLATSAFPCLARVSLGSPPFLVELGREGIESSHSVPPAARNVTG